MLTLAQIMPPHGFGVSDSQWELVAWQRRPDPDRPADTDWTIPDIRRHYVRPKTAYARTVFQQLQRLLRVAPDGLLGYQTRLALERIGLYWWAHPAAAAASAEQLILFIQSSPYLRARAAGFGDDIVPESRLPHWVAPAALGGLLVLVAGFAVYGAMTSKPAKRRR